MNSIRLKITVAIVICAIGAQGYSIEMQPVLNLADAKKMADACEQHAVKKDWRPINIAIVDAGANLKLFRRQDGAFLGSIDIAQLKAKSSARIPVPTRDLGDKVVYKDPARPHGLQHVPGLVIFAGGLPILTAKNQLVGAIGVSGATSDQDEECARVGIDAISELLK